MRKVSIARRLALSVVVLVPISGAAAPALGSSPNYKDVCASGCSYSSVQAAVASITNSSASNVYTVFIDLAGRGIGVSVVQASPQWFQNVASGAEDTPDFFDLTGSTNVSITNLTIDARTADPGTISTPMMFGAVKANSTASVDWILMR